MQMTQEEKRIKLAKYAFSQTQDQEWALVRPLPDYFNDLNAVHELWTSLPRVTRLIVVARLAKILKLPKKNQNEIGELEEALFSATAAKRCEALGLTLNLWT